MTKIKSKEKSNHWDHRCSTGNRDCDNVWDNFEQYNPTLSLIEQLIGDVGKDFIFDGLFCRTVNDDILHHSSLCPEDTYNAGTSGSSISHQ